MLTRETLRMALGATQVLAPEWLPIGLLGGELTPAGQRVVRAVGLRNVVQSVLVTRAAARSPASRRSTLAAGAAVDLLHAGSMVFAAMRFPRHRWLAAAQVVEGTWFGVDQILALREARRHVSGRGRQSRADGRDHPRTPRRTPRTGATRAAALTDPEAGERMSRLRTAAALQRAADSVVERRWTGERSGEHASVRTVEQTMGRLAVAVAAEGLPPQPQTWLEAVSSEAVAGRRYVVSREAARASGP